MRRRRVGILIVLLLAILGVTAFLSVPRAPTAADMALARVIPAIRIDRAPLRDVLESIEREAGVPIVADWNALARAGLRSTVPVDVHAYGMTVGDVLREVARDCERRGASMEARPTGTSITFGPPLEVYRTYDVTDLACHARLDDLPDPNSFKFGGTVLRLRGSRFFGAGPVPADENAYRREKLTALIAERARLGQWSLNVIALYKVRDVGDRLVVLQTPAAHAEITQLLADLRAPPTTPISGIDVVAMNWPRRAARDDLKPDAALRWVLDRELAGDLVFDDVPLAKAVDEIRAAFKANVRVNDYRNRGWTRRTATNVTLILSRPNLESALRAVYDKAFGLEARSPIRFDLAGSDVAPVVVVNEVTHENVMLAYDLGPLLPHAPASSVAKSNRNRLVHDLEQWLTHRALPKLDPGSIRPWAYHPSVRPNVIVINTTPRNHDMVRGWLDARLASQQSAEARR